MNAQRRQQAGPRRRGSGTNRTSRPSTQDIQPQKGAPTALRGHSGHSGGGATRPQSSALEPPQRHQDKYLVKLLARRTLVLLRNSAGTSSKEV
jgi:hypothetical protein